MSCNSWRGSRRAAMECTHYRQTHPGSRGQMWCRRRRQRALRMWVRVVERRLLRQLVLRLARARRQRRRTAPASACSPPAQDVGVMFRVSC